MIRDPRNAVLELNAVSVEVMHKRLGHLGKDTMRKMNLPVPKETCKDCIIGEHPAAKFNRGEGEVKSKNPLDVIHMDLIGPMETSLGGKNYIYSILDDNSRRAWTILLKKKKDVYEEFRNWKTLVEKELERKIKKIKMDRGGEFISNKMKAFMKAEGIDF
jgi:hypothetical protein